MAKQRRFDWILLVILMSYFMILLDNSIIFTGTVKIVQDLHLNQATLSWVSSAYSLTFGGFLLLGGRAGDLFGRRRVFELGLISSELAHCWSVGRQRAHDHCVAGLPGSARPFGTDHVRFYGHL